MVIGTEGFVAWFQGLIYNKILDACKNIYVKVFIHLIGVIAIIIGVYLLITTMPSLVSIGGLFLALIGLVVFVTPFGAKS